MQEPRACPRCRTDLIPKQTSTMTVLACLSCGGMWVDNEGARRLLTALEITVAALARQLHTQAVARPDVSQRSLLCPICRQEMDVRRVAKAAVDVDICEQHGTWFDAGELNRVVDAFHPSEGVPEVDEELIQRELATWKKADDRTLVHAFLKLLSRAKAPGRTRIFDILP